MKLEAPAPPSVPAPAVRPTPPTPPRIDKGAFEKPQVNREVETPETMARDAVAHGSGALTKRTVDKGEESPQVTTEQPLRDTQSDYDRGQDVLREFQELDAREATGNFSAQTLTEQQHHVAPRITQQEGHGVFYWVFTIIFVLVAAGLFGKKFLYTEKRAKVRTPHFDALNKKSAADKPVTPPPNPVTLPPKKDDDKGKHFEVRI